MKLVTLFLALLSMAQVAAPAPAQPSATLPPPETIDLFLDHLKTIVESDDPSAFLDLISEEADYANALNFSDENLPQGVTRAVFRELDRAQFVEGPPGYRLFVETFLERGDRGRIATWRLDLVPSPDPTALGADAWRVADQEGLMALDGLHRLRLDEARQFDIRNLAVNAEDFALTLPEGTGFVAEAAGGVTALVLFGRGTMRFEPTPPAERRQVELFCGREALETEFEAAFIRVHPEDFARRMSPEALTERPADPDAIRRAREVFEQEVIKSFGLDLTGLSPDIWSLLPPLGDFLAEVQTRRYATLTYVRSNSEAEDITLFDRQNKRNIAIYPSKEKLAIRGPFYNEDDLTNYDVLDYDVDVTFDPRREWIDGRTRLRIRVRAAALNTLNLRLAEPFTVRSVDSDAFGRLLSIRARGQDTIIVNLPTLVMKDVVFTLDIHYSGVLPAQAPDREAIQIQPTPPPYLDGPVIVPERRYVYSTRTYWHPQATVSDYATATLSVTVPEDFHCIASGVPALDGPVTLDATEERQDLQKRYTFTAPQPLRYLAFVVSKFRPIETATVPIDASLEDDSAGAGDGGGGQRRVGVFYDAVTLAVQTNPRQQNRGRTLMERATDILKFYSALVGDFPYPSFTLALVESDLPGGHSPAYFCIINQTLPTSPFTWGGDPAHFEEFPDFYLAHELAHQWWGQAIGWKNYHEQWLSEGFAQYFAAMYAEENRGANTFSEVLRQMRRSALDQSDQGPVYLGYRLGHVRGESRVFRALVYNKGAMALHMLRRLVGDDVFFRSIRRYYGNFRFDKAGTEDFRRAVEAEAGRSFERFFQRWIYESAIPTLTFSYSVREASSSNGGQAAREVVLRFVQPAETVFDVPVLVTLNTSSGRRDVVVAVSDSVTEEVVTIDGELRGVDVNRDDGALAEIREN